MTVSSHSFLQIGAWKLFCLCTIGPALLQMNAYALDPNRLMSQYGHTVWRTQDGIVPEDSPITQTADGYIWMAGVGRQSLLRFDGTQFVRWKPPNGAKLAGGQINSLFGAHDGSLWIGTRAALSRLKDGQLSVYTKPSQSSGISTIMEDHSGGIWSTRYRVPKGEGALCEVVGDGLRCYGPSDGLPARYGLGITEDPTGTWWIAGEELYSWKRGTQAKRYLDSGKHPQLEVLATDHSGNVWATMEGVGTQFGVRYFHGGTWGEYSASGFHSSSVWCSGLLADTVGAVWLGCNNGLYRIWKDAVDHFTRNDGLSGESVSFVYEDREGNLWVSTEGGVDLFRNTVVLTYSQSEGMGVNPDTVFASRDGTIWAGSKRSAPDVGQSPDILRPGANQRFSPGPKFPGSVGAMFQDHSGALWFGLENSLAVYRQGRVQKVLSKDGHVLQGEFRGIIEDSTHAIIVVSNTELLRIVDRHVSEAIPLPKRISVSLLTTNPNGGIWIVGQEEGVMLYNNGIIQTSPSPDMSQLKINGLFADVVDPLLLATSKGLFRWDGTQWDVLNESNGLSCNRLLTIIKDGRGAVWLEAECGLLKIEATDLARWRQNSASQVPTAVFDALDGARPGFVTIYQSAMSLAPDGKVWFANGHVIQMFDPDQTYKNLLAPPVHVDQLIADDKPFRPAEQPRLPPNTHNLEINYTAPSFSVPQKVLFRYFLEGRDKGWQGPVTRRAAFYTDLPPATYRFHVVACNNSGVWNETGDVATFVVEPTFYQTVWFKTLLAIAGAALLWGLYHLRLRQATATVQDRLMAQMEERERIARELHDTLLQGFQGITLRVQGVAKNMPDKDPLRKMLDDVLDRADGVLREARQRVRNLRRRTTDENDLADRLTKHGEELSQDHTAAFTLAIVGEPKVLESTAQDEAYRIVGEALTNAFQHASASKIEIEITYESSALRIRVRDDGMGIDKTVVANGHPDHWGLTGMRERARAIRAELNIWSREDAGTEVEVVIPASIAYPREETKAS